MSVPPAMLERMRAQQAPQLPGGGQPGPAAAPMATPEKKDGKREMAYLKVHIGMNMLEQAIGMLGAETPEGQTVLDVLKKLGNKFGDNDTSDLVPAEMADTVQSMTAVGGGNPQQQALMKSMSQGSQPAQFPRPPAPMPMPGAPT